MENFKKRMLMVKNILIQAIRSSGDAPYVPLWLPKEDVEMLIRWLNGRILYEQTYGKEGEV